MRDSADKCGIKISDRIIAVDGQTVCKKTVAQVQALIVDQQQDLADLIQAFDTESEALTHAAAHSDV